VYRAEGEKGDGGSYWELEQENEGPLIPIALGDEDPLGATRSLNKLPRRSSGFAGDQPSVRV
jgi:hypothetical protein